MFCAAITFNTLRTWNNGVVLPRSDFTVLPPSDILICSTNTFGAQNMLIYTALGCIAHIFKTGVDASEAGLLKEAHPKILCKYLLAIFDGWTAVSMTVSSECIRDVDFIYSMPSNCRELVVTTFHLKIWQYTNLYEEIEGIFSITLI